jgi:hypothetical protein
MRDKTHMEQVERWALFVKTHPRSEWIKHVKPLIDSQINMAERFYRKLKKQKNGMEKIKKLKNQR